MKLLLKFLPLLLLAASAQARTLAEVQKSGTLLVATNVPYEPFVFEKDGKLTGFEIELAQAIAQKMGLKAQFENRPFAPLLDDVNNFKPTIDMVIASHVITTTRQKVADFSQPHYCTASVILSKVGGPTVAKELGGYKVGAEMGSIQYGYLKKLPMKITTVPFDNVSGAVTALLGGKIDAIVTDSLLADSAAKNSATKLQVGPSLYKTSRGIAFAKGNNKLRQAVDKVLTELLNDGTYKQLSQKYFGKDVRC